VSTLAGGEAAPGREKGGDNASWANVDLTRLKKMHVVDSIATNR
jgi:hypothetical protein